jgi:MinD superfamily P-loop ATPase
MAVQIAVASGKGGTGKTTVATNLYQYISQADSGKTLLVDCDVEEPNDTLFFPDALQARELKVVQEIPSIDTSRCTFCRKCVEYCEFNAITVLPPVRFAEVNASLCHSCGACAIACKFDAINHTEHPIGILSHYKLDQGAGILEGRLNVGSAMQTAVIRSLKKEIPADLKTVILDGPPGTSCPVVETIADSDFVVLVTEPTPFGLHDLKLMVRLLQEIQKPFGVVINKANLGNRDVYDYLRNKGIEILGEIPFSRTYASKYSQTELFEDTPEEVGEAYKQLFETLHKKALIA